MALTRYLLNIAYTGKPFRGAQRQVTGIFPRADDPSTVQGRLEMGLKELNPCNEPIVFISSRTDTGVHALHSTCHVDMYRRNGLIYEPRAVTLCLNHYFTKEEVPIRVLKTYIVPDDFSCRVNAISRTYLYRLCTVRADAVNMAPHRHLLPIEELHKCYFLCTNKFDVEAMRKAAKLFEGTLDFRSFMGKGTRDPDKVTRRHVYRLEIHEGKSMTYSPYSFPSCTSFTPDDYKYYDIYIEAKGFLYRQVRRTVASLIAVAQGKVTTRDIKFMLEVPSHRSWNPKLQTVPACGLYLCQVKYSQEDVDRFRTDDL